MTKVHIIGISGKKMSGKSTFVDFYKETHLTQRVHTRAFADSLKEACSKLFHFNYSQLNDPVLKEVIDPRWDTSPRKLLQWLGTDIMRDQFRLDFWIYNWLIWFKSQDWKDGDVVFIPDVRFQNEIDFIHDTMGGTVIHINRVHGSEKNTVDHHSSENEKLNNIDIRFDSLSLDALHEFAINFDINKVV